MLTDCAHQKTAQLWQLETLHSCLKGMASLCGTSHGICATFFQEI